MIIFPRPFAIAIDDMGWMQGKNDGENGYGPYRTGIDRNMTLADYKSVVDLAKKVGVRLQGLFILGELDRENILGAFPTTTHQREKWDNSHNISDLQTQIMDFVKAEAAHLEFAFHGVGHEFWPENGVRRRAEWYNTDDDHPWPEEEIIKHVECFIAIMKQYGITKELGHSFPESFVPCAYSYYWNPGGSYSLGSVLAKYGVKYANTDFREIPECNPPEGEWSAGFDHGVHVMNRYNYGNLWHQEGKTPTVPIQDQRTEFIETHWPNLLASKEQNQEEVTDTWVAYYHQVQRIPNRYCAKNTSQLHSQCLYKKHTIIKEVIPGVVTLDNTQMPSEAFKEFFPGNLVLKLKLESGQHISEAQINGQSVSGYFEDQGYGFIYLPPLLQKKYELTYSIGSFILRNTVWHDTTSNIFEVRSEENQMRVTLCLYGSQVLKVRAAHLPEIIQSNNPEIIILDWELHGDLLHIDLKGHDIQGESGVIEITF